MSYRNNEVAAQVLLLYYVLAHGAAVAQLKSPNPMLSEDVDDVERLPIKRPYMYVGSKKSLILTK